MRAQISIEVALITGIAILVIVSMVNLHFERFYVARELGEAGEAKMVGTLIASAIDNAYANGAGFQIYLSPERVNFTRLGEVEKMYGLGVDLPIVINTTAREIVISKNTSKTGGDIWIVEVPIVAEEVYRQDPTAQYPELTVLNNGTGVVIYADAAHIRVVS